MYEKYQNDVDNDYSQLPQTWNWKSRKKIIEKFHLNSTYNTAYEESFNFLTRMSINPLLESTPLNRSMGRSNLSFSSFKTDYLYEKSLNIHNLHNLNIL